MVIIDNTDSELFLDMEIVARRLLQGLFIYLFFPGYHMWREEERKFF